MHKFIRNLITEWRRLDLPFADKTIVIAVSGGADSVSLALALHKLRELKKLKLNFIVAHFNHKLRGAESEKDAEFVENLAGKLNFEFIGGKPKSKLQNQRENLEQLARAARYEFLENAANNKNAQIVLTAHTLNDQAETFLMNLLRGSGLDGLGAMQAKRSLRSQVSGLKSHSKSEIRNPQSEIELIRPFLNWTKREATENFCSENKIEFRHDAMNEDLTFSRVRIRRQLIPLLQTFNPKIIETLAGTANLLRADGEQLAATAYQVSENLELRELKFLSKSMLYRILRAWLRKHRGDLRRIESKHLEAVENLIFSTKSGRIIELPDGENIVKKQGKIFFEKSKVEKSRQPN